MTTIWETSETELTDTAHDANGFPINLPHPVNFSMEESDEWFCKFCDEDAHGDVDDAGHRYDGETAEQIWTAVPLEEEEDGGNGGVWTGTFKDAFAYFCESFMGEGSLAA